MHSVQLANCPLVSDVSVNYMLMDSSITMTCLTCYLFLLRKKN